MVMRVFVGCSGDIEINADDILLMLKSELAGSEIELIYWRDYFNTPNANSFFTWSRFKLALEDSSERCECAIMIWHGDDAANARGNEYRITRDNVILETGAFLGARGLNNVFLITDNSPNYHFASDLSGLNTYQYDFQQSARSHANIENIRLIAARLKRIQDTLPSKPEEEKIRTDLDATPSQNNQVPPVSLRRRELSITNQ